MAETSGEDAGMQSAASGNPAQGIMKIFGSALNRGMARHEGNKLVKEARKARKYRQMELAEDLRALSKAQKYAEGEAIVQIAQTGVMADSGTPQQFMSQMREIHRYNKAMMFLEGMHEADQISKDAYKERWNMYERAHQQNVSSWLGSDITNMAGSTPDAREQMPTEFQPVQYDQYGFMSTGPSYDYSSMGGMNFNGASGTATGTSSIGGYSGDYGFTGGDSFGMGYSIDGGTFDTGSMFGSDLSGFGNFGGF